MVAFGLTTIIGFGFLGLVVWYGSRRDPSAPLSWGEAMAAATFVFFVAFWFYGVIPHQWLAYADNELGWRSDKILVGPGGILEANRFQPITFTYLVIRDVLVVGIYVVGLGGLIAMWAWWNNRSKPKEVVVPASRYGRPLVRQG